MSFCIHGVNFVLPRSEEGLIVVLQNGMNMREAVYLLEGLCGLVPNSSGGAAGDEDNSLGMGHVVRVCVCECV